MEDTRGQFISHTRREAAPSPQMGKQEHRGTHEHSCGDKSSEPGHRKIPYPKRPGNQKASNNTEPRDMKTLRVLASSKPREKKTARTRPAFGRMRRFAIVT